MMSYIILYNDSYYSYTEKIFLHSITLQDCKIFREYHTFKIFYQSERNNLL